MRQSDIFETWRRLASGSTSDLEELECFFRLTGVWMAFNSLYKTKYPRAVHQSEREQILAFARDQKAVHSQLRKTDEDYAQAVECIAAKGVRNVDRNREEKVDDPDDFEQVMTCVYTIRCNFIHGDKHPHDERDRALVAAAYTIMSRILAQGKQIS